VLAWKEIGWRMADSVGGCRSEKEMRKKEIRKEVVFAMDRERWDPST
jgi:hypothetical protein